MPESIVADGPSKGMAHVKRTLQIAVPKPAETDQNGTQNGTQSSEPEGSEPQGDDDHEDDNLTAPYPHLFAIGDAADAFGAINAGHTAYYQGEVAARNILALIRQSEGERPEDAPLQPYKPGAPAIKISLGLVRSIYSPSRCIDWLMKRTCLVDPGLIRGRRCCWQERRCVRGPRCRFDVEVLWLRPRSERDVSVNLVSSILSSALSPH